MAENNTRILAGRYEVGELLGRGGMAEVHLGHDRRLSRTVAIKILRSDLARDPSFQTRFRREAQSAAALNHPAIVSVYDTGEDVTTDATGAEVRMPFIVMEYVEGHTVRELIRDGSALPLAEAIEVTNGVLTALEYSHRAGIVHRDIKPGNVMITPTGAIKVMDFGIARAMADSAATMTQTHAVVGTAQYLSPEQARGEVVDTRSDLYSTGCLLYELLTGRPPFVGDSAVAVAYQHVSEPPTPPSAHASDIPVALDQIVLKALAKNRDDRYATAAQFRADLEAASRNEAIAPTTVEAATQLLSPAVPPVAPAPTPTPTTPATALLEEFPEPEAIEEDTKKKRTGLIVLLSILGVLLIAGIVWAMADRNKEPDPIFHDIPDLSGMTYNEARDELQALNLRIDQGDPIPHATIEKDLVAAWNPQGNVEEGTLVTVQLSSGPASVTVPNLEDKTIQEARDLLDDVNAQNGSSLTLAEASEPQNHDEIEEGRIISWDPRDEVAPDAVITVTLSAGPGELTVPDIEGAVRSQAETLLRAAGIENFEFISEDLPGRALNEVDRTEPEIGATVAADATLQVYVGTGQVVIDRDLVINQPLDDVRTYLEGELKLRVTDVHNQETAEMDPGRVLSFNPDTTKVSFDQTFALWVAQTPSEPEPEPSSEEPTTEEPPADEDPGDEGEG